MMTTTKTKEKLWYVGHNAEGHINKVYASDKRKLKFFLFCRYSAIGKCLEDSFEWNVFWFLCYYRLKNFFRSFSDPRWTNRLLLYDNKKQIWTIRLLFWTKKCPGIQFSTKYCNLNEYTYNSVKAIRKCNRDTFIIMLCQIFECTIGKQR